MVKRKYEINTDRPRKRIDLNNFSKKQLINKIRGYRLTCKCQSDKILEKNVELNYLYNKIERIKKDKIRLYETKVKNLEFRLKKAREELIELKELVN